MKKTLLLANLIAIISIPVYAADYQSFIAPSSLGKNINTLNDKYDLELKKQNSGIYSNRSEATCTLIVSTNKKSQVNLIKIIPNKGCQYTVKSNINYNSQTTTIQDLLKQVDLKEIQFIPGCFNCSAKSKATDTLVIRREKDSYYTKFEIKGYNKEYLNYIANNLFGNLSDNNYDALMNTLELRAAEDPNLYDRNEFKLQAVEAYNLQDKPQSYTIALK